MFSYKHFKLIRKDNADLLLLSENGAKLFHVKTGERAYEQKINEGFEPSLLFFS